MNSPRHCSEFEFQAEVIVEQAKRIGWLDEELLNFLRYGFSDYLIKTPPVFWFTPPSASIYKHLDVFKTNVKDKIEKNWMSEAWPLPPRITFRVSQARLYPSHGVQISFE